MVAVPAGYADLLERPLYGHLATTRPDGSVQVSPMWFDWDGELLRFAHTAKRQKYRNVQRNPRVAMSISDPDNPYRYLEVRGDVERIEPDKAAGFFGVSPSVTAATSLPPTPRPGARLPATPRTGWSSWCARPGSASTDTAGTSMTTPNIDLGRFGVFTWDPGSSFLDFGLAVTPEQAQDIERLGYRTLWVTGSPAAELSFAEPLLESTTALKVATGIVNIWTADAKTVAASFHRINTAHPGRFVLGIGAGHPEHTEHYRKPYDTLVDYLDELDEYRVPATQRVLAALGPRVLRLAAERTAGRTRTTPHPNTAPRPAKSSGRTHAGTRAQSAADRRRRGGARARPQGSDTTTTSTSRTT